MKYCCLNNDENAVITKVISASEMFSNRLIFVTDLPILINVDMSNKVCRYVDINMSILIHHISDDSNLQHASFRMRFRKLTVGLPKKWVTSLLNPIIVSAWTNSILPSNQGQQWNIAAI